ncbi:hypothetical protein LO772_33135 [Yinghuangia sp. ASG 101]|uniref:hypothetical protein n=1 Tax=Yinghuangia sp. ASG 101 TaxID=2896848 RepID=UPI001E3DFA8B|nr:hypothetical protein [Yinghuangia sp. ASG 101]UGQ11568.1 hypothetical protein LO772_33135 [Yinghuangia sp. ASG 101]
MPVRTPFRVVRAALFAAVCVLLALSGHAVMSDAPVPWWTAPAAFAALTCVAWAVAAREQGLVAIGSGVLIAQAALHSLFAWVQPAAAPQGLTRDQVEAQWLRLLLCNAGHPPADGTRTRSAAQLLSDMGLDPALAAGPPGLGGHTMPSGHPMSGTAVAEHGHGVAFAPFHGGAGMLGVHLLAALGSAVWLRRGERALFDLTRLLAARASGLWAMLRAAATAYGVPPLPRHARFPVRVAAATPRWSCRPLMRRGPPVPVLV